MRNNPLFKEFENALTEARVAIKVAKNVINKNIPDVIPESASAYSLLPEVELSLEDVKNSVLQDISRYVATPSSNEVDDSRYNFTTVNTMTTEEEDDDQSRFSSFLTSKLKAALHKPIETKEVIDLLRFAKLDAPCKYLYMVVAKEIDGIESISFSQKIKKILFSIGEERIEEAITLARNAKKDEPHNNIVSFILSQILYFKAHHNHAECLPEARDEAKKACTYVESFSEKKLLRYRYHCIATERYFSPERALDIMREYYMTNPESLTGKEGISANHFYNLRCWIILSTIPTNLWRAFEVESLKEITERAIGGTLIYVYYLRESILAEMDSANELFTEQFSETEKLLAIFYYNYSQAKSAIDTNFNTQFAIKGSSPYLWITSHRCMQYFLTLAPMPSSDEILMHTSLDAFACDSTSYPEANMVKVGLENTDYWRSWAIALTPIKENRSIELIPFQRLSEVKELFPIYTKLLGKLESLEKNITTTEDWDGIEEFMPLYAYENLLEIGNGGPSTQLLRTKEDAPFLPYYRKWRKDTEPSPLPSKMIKQHAMSGAFINFKEIHTFFEGIYRVFSSSQYNLQQHTHDAREAYNFKHNIRARKPISQHIYDLWWLYFIIIPIAGFTFLTVMSNSNPATALKILVTILGGVIIFGAVLLIVLPERSKK